MVLNIFPRRKEAERTEPPLARPEQLPEPAPEVLAEVEAAAPRRRTRAPRAKPAEAVAVEAAPSAPDEAAAEVAPRGSRRRRPAAPRQEEETVEAAAAAEPAPAPEAVAEAAEPAADDGAEAAPSRRRRRRGGGGGQKDGQAAPTATVTGNGHAPAGEGAILRVLEQQGRQIDQLVRLHEDLARRSGGGGATMAPAARVGVFVDAANIELASDRMRSRFDWKKILDLLTRDRQLVRAIAYSPVHDDPGVSIETQRFVEPFLDRGYKVVTKPLKRFQDGTIKANVDIELALDVVEMLDRLDVVCLVSGDGDFQRLVEVVQSKGVRCEVVAVGSSTAANLRNAADAYIDLQQRVREVRA